MPSLQRIVIMSGNANRQLAERMVVYAKRRLADVTVSRFRDGETQVIINDDIRGADVFIVQPTSPPVNEHLMELLVMIDAARRASAGRITAVVPYYGYMRQEKKTEGREPISAKLVANLMTVAGADRLLTVDLTNAAIEGFFDIPVDHLSAMRHLAERISALRLQNVVLVAPDVGAVRRVERFRTYLRHADVAVVFKDRPRPDEAVVSGIVGDVAGKTAVIVDDIVSTGGTLIAAADALLDNGAERVLAAVTHPVLAPGAAERLAAAPIEKIFITDTIALDEVPKPFEMVSLAALLAEAVNRIHYGISLSELMSDSSPVV
nr:ribose-phosphate pyrophosphokinase [Ardenticatena sp.]